MQEPCAGGLGVLVLLLRRTRGPLRIGCLRRMDRRRRRLPVAAREELPGPLQGPAAVGFVPHQPPDQRREAAYERVVAGQQLHEARQAPLVRPGRVPRQVLGEERIGTAHRVQDGRAEGVQVDDRRHRGCHLVGGAQLGGGVAGGGAEDPPLPLPGRHLQVDQDEPAVRGDHDVVGVEVVEGDAQFVGGGDELDELPDQGVGGAVVGAAAAVPGQSFGDGAPQRRPRYRRGGQEHAALLLEHLDEPGDTAGARAAEPFEQRGLAAQQVPDVETFEAGSHVGPGLLDDDLRTGPGVLGAEHPALVGVLDRAPYQEAVVQEDGLGRGRAAGRGGRPVGERVSGPGRRGEPGVALVGDRPALGVGETGGEGAVGRQLTDPPEHAVPVEDLAVGPVAPVGKDGGAGQPLGGPVQFLGEQPEPVVVGRVHGQELAAAAPREAPGHQRGDPGGAPRELEGRAVGDEHLRGPGQDQGGGERGGRDVDLPALGTPDGLARYDMAPELALIDAPVHRPGSRRSPAAALRPRCAPGDHGAHDVGQQREVRRALGARPPGPGAVRGRTHRG